MNARQRTAMLPNSNRSVYRTFILAALLALSGAFPASALPASVAPLPLAVRDGWAAFVHPATGRCWMASRSDPAQGAGAGAVASLVMDRGGWPQPHVRLPRPLPPGARAELRIDGRRVPVRAVGAELWTLDERADRLVARAMRGGETLDMVARDAAGRVRRHRWPLAGAATAMDAMLLACR